MFSTVFFTFLFIEGLQYLYKSSLVQFHSFSSLKLLVDVVLHNDILMLALTYQLISVCLAAVLKMKSQSKVSLTPLMAVPESRFSSMETMFSLALHVCLYRISSHLYSWNKCVGSMSMSWRTALPPSLPPKPLYM